MNVAQRVLSAIRDEGDNGSLTNNQLAIRLGLNEPSVRRVTFRLSLAGKIQVADGGYSGLPLQYRSMPTPAATTRQAASV